ncbi:MAG TPA: DUF1501 domain-containing protein [Kofleriaceae bacterium]|jgi:uncharacterized protein (DUF1501 family)
MNRRELLTLAGAAGLAGLFSRTARAKPRSSKPAKRLVLVMAQGGWDTTYALDPKTQSASVDVPAGALTMFEDIPIFADASRPNTSAFFTQYAANTAVIRGISVASVAHQECVKRMSTGTREETNPDMGAIVAHDLGNALPLPYLILGDTAFTGAYAVSSGRVGATNQIIALLDPAQGYKTDGATPFATTAAEDALVAQYAQATADRVHQTRGALGYNRARVDDFVEAIDRGQRLIPVRSGFGTRGRTLAIDSQVALGLDALQQGISQAVMLNTRLAWDTHTANEDQAGFHETTFAALTSILDGLGARPGLQSGTTMLDDTVVICYSEFSRTPKLNANGGKDHWPVTSALVMGAGVRGGKAYGATTDDVQTTPIDLATGLEDPDGTVLSSEQLVAGLLELCGVAPTDHLGATEVFDAFVA